MNRWAVDRLLTEIRWKLNGGVVSYVTQWWTGAPAVDENGIYVTWISGTNFVLFGLNHDGQQIWRHEIPCDFASRFGPGASPIVLDGTVITSNEHAGELCFLIGVDARSGEIAWGSTSTVAELVNTLGSAMATQ